MKKSLEYGLRAVNISWKANGFSAWLEIVSKLYDSTIYPLIQVFLLAKLLDLLETNRSIKIEIWWIVGSYLIGSIVKLWMKSYIDIKGAFLQTRMEGYVDLMINHKLTELDPATFEKPEFQSLIAQLEGIKGTLQMHLIRFTGLVDAAFKFVTATIVVSATFPIFAPLILIATIPSYFAWDNTRKRTWPYYVEKKSLLTRVTQYVKHLLSSDLTSKEAAVFGTGNVLLSKIKKEQQLYLKDFAKVNDPWIIKIFIGRIIQFSAFVYSQYINLLRVFGGSLSIGQFTLIFQQTLNLTLGAEEILNQYSSMSARNKYLDKFFDFLDTKPAIPNPSHPKDIPTKPNPPLLELKNISFRYPETRRDILKDFNLTINSGEKIALVGENGAGKSTLIKLLLRFYDVSEGEILINGVDIKNVDLNKWRHEVGALFQDFIKYQFTLRENIEYGNIQGKSDEKLLTDAITKSGVDGFIDQLPEKLNQVVGKMFDGGIDLSGGQWQKLALARAFYRNAPILILDEPTSAIDAKAEYEIFERVQKLQKDKTVIIISHRFSTVRNADRILVLDNGKIIEEGNHEKLMKKKGLYAELFNLQAKGYK